MPAMVLCFAVMNILFISALTLGTAANAIFLQYTAPLWLFLAGVWLLGENVDRRSAIALGIGMAGIAVIIAGGINDDHLPTVALALGSGVAYAGVLLFLRVLRDASSRWLTVLNHLGAAVVILPWVWMSPTPTLPQLAVLAIFGSIQMGLAYWLVARGLRVVSPQEAGTITLLEPLLSPLWAYLVAAEVPSNFTLLGGAFIVGALAWRYWPTRKKC
jgi:drug/metabolite transporter (DMT)-like permease